MFRIPSKIMFTLPAVHSNLRLFYGEKLPVSRAIIRSRLELL